VRQWIVSGVGGRPDVRQRNVEFATRGDVAVADLAAHLRGLVDEAVTAIEGLAWNRLAVYGTGNMADVYYGAIRELTLL
jgi:hypothetical protein